MSDWKMRGHELVDGEFVPSMARERKPSIRKRAVARIPKNRRAARAATHVVLGTAVVLGKVGKVAGKEAARASVRVGRRVKADVARTLYGPSGTPIAGHRLRRIDVHTCACGVSTTDLQTHTAHMIAEHRGEQRHIAPRPTIVRSTVRRTAGKTIVRPTGMAPTGRHRKPKVAGGKATAERIARLAQKWQPHLVKIGEINMSGDTAARGIRRAFENYADQPKAKTLEDLRNQITGLERALVAGAEFIGDYGQILKRSAEAGGLEIMPELVNPFVKSTQEALVEASRAATRLIVGFEIVYHAVIVAERNKVKKPNLKLG